MSYRLELIPVARTGLFAEVLAVLSALELYEKGKLTGLKVIFEEGNYYQAGRKSNWWENYFSPIDVGVKTGPMIRHPYDLINNVNLFHLIVTIPRERHCELVKRYIHPIPEIKEQLAAFVDKELNGFTTIGIHYRGTDKKQEARIIPIDDFISVIQCKIAEMQEQLQREGGQLRLFVATDEAAFLARMRELFSDTVVSHPVERSTDGRPIHLDLDSNAESNGPYESGRMAMLDCLTLSRCQILIRTSSCLSHVASLFNVDQPVILVT